MSDKEKKEERKGAAAPWMARSTSVGGRLFGQGTPLSGFKAWMSTLLQSKILLLVTAAAAAGYSGLGLLDIHGRGFGVPTNKPGGTFFSPSVDSTSYARGGLPGTPSSSNLSSLEMFNKANKGAAGDETAAPKEGEGAANAAADPNAAAADPNAAMGDPNAMANAMGDPSAAMGGALGGGGGIGKLSGPLGGGGGSGAGSSASMSLAGASKGGGSDASGARGVSTPPRNPAGMRSKMAASSRGRALGNTSTLRRLSNMQNAMAQARNVGSEQAYGVHDGQWSSAATPAGVAGSDASGVRQDGTGQSISPSEGGGSGNPFNDTKYFPNDGGETTVPDIEETKNVTPYQKMVDYATTLLMIASALTMAAFVAWLLAKVIPQLATVAALLSKAGAVAAMGAAALGAGIIATSGQYLQGGIFVAVGGLTALLAWKAAASDPRAAIAKETAKEAAKQIAKQAAMQLGASMIAQHGAGLAKAAGDVNGLGTGVDLQKAAGEAVNNFVDSKNTQAAETYKNDAKAVTNVGEAISKMWKQIRGK